MQAKSICVILLVVVLAPLVQANLVRNPSMEGDFDGGVAEQWIRWSQSGEPSSRGGQFDQGGHPHSGSKSQEIEWHGSHNPFGVDGVYQQISSLQRGQYYRISVWFKFHFEAEGPNAMGDGEITFSVGIDPNGGTEPNGVTDWVGVSDYGGENHRGRWLKVETSFSAITSEATVFIKVAGRGSSVVHIPPEYEPELGEWVAYCYIDDVVVEAMSTVGVTIGPQAAVDAGAQWRVDGGEWHDSGDAEPDLFPGYHEVEFKALAEWEEPVKLRVRVVSGLKSSAAGTYESLSDFNMGEISAQRVWHGQRLEFLVHSDELGPSASLSLADPHPVGVGFDAVTRLFSYTPGTGDKRTFYVTFAAELRGEVRSQKVEITPMPHLGDEEDAFGMDPSHDVPDANDRDYIVLNTVYSDDPEWLNHANRWNEELGEGTRTISISGKEIVFEQGTWPHNSCSGNPDIKKMNIYAERVIIRSPLVLHETNVTIYAKELRFEDLPGLAEKACINTTPRRDDSLDRPPGDGGTPGEAGLKAGDITLHIEKFHSEVGGGTRFILKGEKGQGGGLGHVGTTPAPYALVPPPNLPGGWGPYAGHVVGSSGLDGSVRGHSFGDWPPNGGNAQRAGIPGDGGPGGIFSCNLYSGDLQTLVDFSGGVAGDKGPYYPGGPGGEPNPSYYIILTWGGFDVRGPHYQSNGKSEPAPNPANPIGEDGGFSGGGNGLSWLSPYALRMIIAHAKDAYLYGHLDETKEILGEYMELLDIYRSSEWWDEIADANWEFEFGQMRDEMATILHRIDNNLDYFGNPAGWVPMLSFEVNKELFEDEFRHAMRVLYLAYWVGGEFSDMQEDVNALGTARQESWDEIGEFKNDYNIAIEAVSKLNVEVINISNEAESLQHLLQGLEERLVARAAVNVEERHKVPEWKKVARVAGAICQVFPVGQPYLAVAGVGLTLISKYDSDDPWASVEDIKGLRKYKYAKYGESAQAWKEEVDTIELRVIEANGLGTYFKNLDKFSGPMQQAVGEVMDVLKKTQIPASELKTEIDNLKASDPEYQELAKKVAKLVVKRQQLADALTIAHQAVSRLSNDITYNILAIDGMNRKIGAGNALLDPRVKMYLGEMERRARERLLRYHYYMAKAYEYRMLEQYEGELNLQTMFVDKFQAIVAAGRDEKLDESDFEALRIPYEEELRKIADDIYKKYNPTGRQEKTRFARLKLTRDQLQQLNRGESVTVNPMELGRYYPDEEAIRITGVEAESLRTNIIGDTGGAWNTFTLRMEHSGESKLMLDGKVFMFRHYNKPDDEPTYWEQIYHTDGIIEHWETVDRSFASESLLYSLLTTPEGAPPDKDTMLFYSRPAGWSDIIISKNDHRDNNVVIDLSDVSLLITYDCFLRRENQFELQVLPSEEGFRPYIIVEQSDENGREDGRGGFRRFYPINKAVTLKAPERYGSWVFEKWTDKDGNEVGSGSNPVLPLFMDEDQAVRAQYIREVMLLCGNVQTVAGVGIIGAAVSADSNEGILVATTDDDGFYSFTLARGWSGTVTPWKAGYTFSPDSNDYSNITSDQRDQDYEGGGLPTMGWPTGVSASEGTFVGKVEVTWGSVSGASHYRVYRSTSKKGTKTRLSDWQSSTTYKDSTAQRGSTYLYWVRAATSNSGDQASPYSYWGTGWLSEVLPAGDMSGNYVVNGEDFAMFGAHWQETGCTEENDWCGGADLAPGVPDGVNGLDLAVFADNWLGGLE